MNTMCEKEIIIINKDQSIPYRDLGSNLRHFVLPHSLKKAVHKNRKKDSMLVKRDKGSTMSSLQFKE